MPFLTIIVLIRFPIELISLFFVRKSIKKNDVKMKVRAKKNSILLMSVLLMSVMLLCPIIAFCGDDAKVYSDGDLEQYSYGGNGYMPTETRLNNESKWKEKDFVKAWRELEETKKTIREAKDEKSRQEAILEKIKIEQIIEEHENKRRNGRYRE